MESGVLCQTGRACRFSPKNLWTLVRNVGTRSLAGSGIDQFSTRLPLSSCFAREVDLFFLQPLKAECQLALDELAEIGGSPPKSRIL